jgi:hypothetical protein
MHLVQLALVVMTVGRLDRDPTAHDAVIELLELAGLFANVCFDGG